MIVDLSPEELEAIRHWYAAALGESATVSDEVEVALIQKLGLSGIWLGKCSWCGSIPHVRPCVGELAGNGGR